MTYFIRNGQPTVRFLAAACVQRARKQNHEDREQRLYATLRLCNAQAKRDAVEINSKPCIYIFGISSSPLRCFGSLNSVNRQIAIVLRLTIMIACDILRVFGHFYLSEAAICYKWYEKSTAWLAILI